MRRFALVPALAIAPGAHRLAGCRGRAGYALPCAGGFAGPGRWGLRPSAATSYVPLLADYYAGSTHADAKGRVNLAVRGEETGTFTSGQMNAAVGTILTLNRHAGRHAERWRE